MMVVRTKPKLQPAAARSGAGLSSLLPDVRDGLDGIETFCEARDYVGWDPYDALNSPLLRALTLGLKYPRIAVTQALKVLPVNLRRVLFVKPTRNPKGLGLFLSGAVRRYRVSGDERHAQRARNLAAMLVTLRSPGHHYACWGYPFPWQSRAFYVPRWTPTIVNTAFVGHAFVDAAEAFQQEIGRASCRERVSKQV